MAIYQEDNNQHSDGSNSIASYSKKQKILQPMEKKQRPEINKSFDAMSAKVIDGDNMKILEWYDPKDEYEVRERYEAMGKWDDMSIDRDGDLILWKE